MNDSNARRACKRLITIPRRWFPLWVLDWYILREFLIKYCILMLVFVLLFVLSDVYNSISDFLEAGASIWDVVRYLAAKLPGNIRFILPISMLLGCMWCMATFGKNLEITAMRASGVSLFRCGVPIFAAGLVVTGVNIYFNEFLVPRTEKEAERIYAKAADSRDYVQNLLAYRSPDGKRHWLFKTFVRGEAQKDVTLRTYWNEPLISKFIGSPRTPGFRERVGRVMPSRAAAILSLDPEGQERAVARALNGRKVDIFARETQFDPKNKEWIFLDGHFVSYDRKDERDAMKDERKTPARRGTFGERCFLSDLAPGDHAEIERFRHKFTPSGKFPLRKRDSVVLKEFSLDRSTLKIIAEGKELELPLSVAENIRVIRTAPPEEGTSAVHPEEKYKELVFTSKQIPERPDDIANAVREKDDLSTAVILDLVKRNPNMPDRVKKIYMTLFFYRISFPWACLIAVFLGIPLATKNERTGSLLAVITAVVIIVAYIVVAQIFLIFGKAGLCPPVIAGTLPTLCFIVFGIWRVFFDRN